MPLARRAARHRPLPYALLALAVCGGLALGAATPSSRPAMAGPPGGPVVLAGAVSLSADTVGPSGCPEGMDAVRSSPGSCTHGDDSQLGAAARHPAPHDDGDGISAATSGTGATRTAPAAVPCVGDGTSGNRIAVYYGYLRGHPNRIGTVAPRLRDAILRANGIVVASARETGGSRSLRLLTSPACAPLITPVALPASAAGSFDATVAAMRAAHLGATNRKYVLFLDASRICGQGSVRYDDGAGIGNDNNAGPSYARLDTACWDGASAAHEIFHMLGAVQPSSPHNDGGLHCTDEWDLMCYAGAGPKRVTTRCVAWLEDERADCGKDDYFSTAPRARSYLATHWNTAGNSFLYGGGRPRPAPPNDVRFVKATLPATNRVHVTWSAPTGSRVTSYVVDRDSTTVYRGSATTFTDTHPLGGAHTYWVIARNESGYSPHWQGYRPVPARPGAAVSLRVRVTAATTGSLTWGRASGRVLGYRVYRATGSGADRLVGTAGWSTLHLNDTHATRGAWNTWWVCAYNEGGQRCAPVQRYLT